MARNGKAQTRRRERMCLVQILVAVGNRPRSIDVGKTNTRLGMTKMKRLAVLFAIIGLMTGIAACVVPPQDIDGTDYGNSRGTFNKGHDGGGRGGGGRGN